MEIRVCLSRRDDDRKLNSGERENGPTLMIINVFTTLTRFTFARAAVILKDPVNANPSLLTFSRYVVFHVNGIMRKQRFIRFSFYCLILIALL